MARATTNRLDSEGRGVATDAECWLGVMVMEKQAEQREKRRTCQKLHT